MEKRLIVQAITKFKLGIMVVALLLFVSSGTLHYWNA